MGHLGVESARSASSNQFIPGQSLVSQSPGQFPGVSACDRCRLVCSLDGHSIQLSLHFYPCRKFLMMQFAFTH
jgi:hypothetical protein